MPAPAKVFEMVSTATVSKSAAQAKEMLILRESRWHFTMNRYRLLADAKAKALALVDELRAAGTGDDQPAGRRPDASAWTALSMASTGAAWRPSTT